MAEPGGEQQLALLLQVICKELQELSNEVVVLQNEELLRYRLVKEIMSPKKDAS